MRAFHAALFNIIPKEADATVEKEDIIKLFDGFRQLILMLGFMAMNLRLIGR